MQVPTFASCVAKSLFVEESRDPGPRRLAWLQAWSTLRVDLVKWIIAYAPLLLASTSGTSPGADASDRQGPCLGVPKVGRARFRIPEPSRECVRASVCLFVDSSGFRYLSYRPVSQPTFAFLFTRYLGELSEPCVRFSPSRAYCTHFTPAFWHLRPSFRL